MKCDQCDNAAVVHELVIRNGVTSEVHLCAEHAAARGYQIPVAPVAQMLTQFAGAAAQADPRAGRPGAGTCAGCGLTFQEFRQHGILGCAACYESFGPPLAALIERSQAGASSHVGRTPARLEGLADRTLARQRLLRELEAAVAAEQYERAARLRDRLHALDAPPGSEAP
ncbi:MAG: UvrB/UvrC motif-containing protein [Phycisphaerales bacterium]